MLGFALALLFPGLLPAQQSSDFSSWAMIRQLGDSELSATAMVASDSQLPALLTLAERNLNRNASAALEQLDQASQLLQPDSDEAAYAVALRCQALHRQGSGDEACEPYRQATPTVNEPVIQAFIHATRSYLLYRERPPP